MHGSNRNPATQYKNQYRKHLIRQSDYHITKVFVVLDLVLCFKRAATDGIKNAFLEAEDFCGALR